ncbi:MAG: ribonuclease P protein component [Rickettsiales bacterium]|nr:ribonuclease P protein component [Rickettsiales bacterium]
MEQKAPFIIIPNRRDFLAANSGKRFVTGSFILQMLKREAAHPALSPARFGFTVTKKIGNAVVRNRTKRRLREATRAIGPQHSIEGHDYVIIAREKAHACAYTDLLRDMEFAFSRISSMKDGYQPKPRPKK